MNITVEIMPIFLIVLAIYLVVCVGIAIITYRKIKREEKSNSIEISKFRGEFKKWK